MKLTGVVKDGELVIDPVAWAIALREFAGRRVTVDIDAERAIRSVKQNNRYWGVLVPLAGDFLGKTRDVPLSKEQVHYVLTSAFLGCDQTPLGLVPMRTRDLDTKQFAAYCEKVGLWLMEQGYHVPEPGE